MPTPRASLTHSLVRLRLIRWRRQARGRAAWLVLGLKVLFGLYVAFLLVFFGLFAREAAILYAGRAEPLGLLHAYVAPAWAGLFAARYLTQSGLRGSLQPYLVLPVDRRALVQRMTALGVVNLHTVLPMLFLGAFAASTLAPSYGWVTAARWTLLLLAALVCADLLCRWLRLHPWRYAHVRTALLMIGGTVALDLLTLRLLPWIVRVQLDATLLGSPWPLLGLATAAGLLFVAVTRAQHEALLSPFAAAPHSLALGAFVPGRPVRSALRLEVLLMARHRRTRQLLLTSAVLVTVYPLILGATESVAAAFAVGLLASGMVAFNYGPLMFGWDGRFLDGQLTRPLALRHLVTAKVVLLAGSVALCAAATVPLFLALRPHLIVPTLAAGAYGAGVGVPLTVLVSLSNREAIDLSASQLFNYQGLTARQLAGGALVGLPAFGLVLALGDAGLAVVALVGGVGVAALPLSALLLARRFERTRHAMAAAFRET